MASSTLGHISDLHFGLSQTHERTAAALCDALMAARVDHVVVSGDITHRGRADELERFEGMFHPLLRTGRMTVIPGNHDRLGHDVRRRISGDARVWLRQTDGLCIVCVDSTGPHNRGWLASYGQVTLDEVAEIEAMLAQAPAGVLKVVTLHHHPLPLPEDTLTERLISRLGSPNGMGILLGPELASRLCGQCDLLLHGHRHHPRNITMCSNESLRPLHIVNAGCSTELGQLRIFSHARGRLTRDPFWLSAQLDGLAIGTPRRPSNRASGWWSAARAFVTV